MCLLVIRTRPQSAFLCISSTNLVGLPPLQQAGSHEMLVEPTHQPHCPHNHWRDFDTVLSLLVPFLLLVQVCCQLLILGTLLTFSFGDTGLPGTRYFHYRYSSASLTGDGQVWSSCLELPICGMPGVDLHGHVFSSHDSSFHDPPRVLSFSQAG